MPLIEQLLGSEDAHLPFFPIFGLLFLCVRLQVDIFKSLPPGMWESFRGLRFYTVIYVLLQE